MTPKTFIDRPILSGVISVFIVVLGVIGLLNLPIEQFPEIAPPTVSVRANYTGANAETVQKSVIIPLEESLNGVENMMYMTSSATNTGSGSISIFFKQGTDADMAMVNVQNRVASTQGQLPADVTRSGVTVRKRQTSNIKSLSLYSPTDAYDTDFLTNYMKINIEPRLSRVAGVGEVNVWGASYSMRIWLDPLRMASYGLMPSDIDNVLAEQNIEAPTGTLGADSKNTFQYVLKYRGRYEEEHDYENLVVKSLPDGSVLRLKDVARVELGIQNYTFQNSTNGHAGANCMIAQTPGSNANEIIKHIDETALEIKKELPPGMELVDVMSTKDFLDASIHNVVRTLLEAIILVVLVVYIFLQDLRSTFIPSLAIVVSLIGTFAVLYFIGFSLNLLTLFALVLVIGTVVDDAIVVVEAVQAKFDEGYRSPYLASVDAMKGLTSALITTTIVFMSVFIPVCFVGGTTGVFYTQFGVTMAIAVVISTINAMTLSPALCALMLRPRKEGDTSFSARFHDAFTVSFQRVVGKYQRGVLRIFRHRWVPWVSVVLVCILLGYMLKTTRTGFVPNEDMGSINVNVQCAPGTSMAITGQITREVERRIKDIPQFRLYNMTIGRGSTFDQSSSAGSFNIRLKNWDERKEKGDDINSVIEEIYRRTADITQAQIRVSTRPMISGYGATSGFELHVQDRKGGKIEDLMRYTRILIDSLNQEPAISRAFTTFDTKYPQYRVEVDAARCKRDGVTPNAVLKVLSGYVGGTYSSNLTRFTKLYRVIVQASPEFRLDEQSLSNMRVRSESGQMIPITQYISMKRVYGSEGLNRFNLFSSIAVMGQTADGYSSGQTLEAIRRTAAKVLPEGYGYEFGGMSREEASLSEGLRFTVYGLRFSISMTAIIFVIVIVFVYLILCALYESLFIPLAVILSVPFGLLGSFLFSNMWGLENNIYMQTGLIMLIGLLAKTAILLTEYATERHRQGMSITMAAMTAARVRLRPILMTSLTMIFGMLPLVFAHGVGANGNNSLGVGCAGGMLVGTIALLFVVPVLYMPFQWLHSRFGHMVK